MVAHVQQAYAKPRPTLPPWPSPGQTYHEGFDQPYRMTTNQVADPTVWSESWSGWALERSGRNPQVAPWTVPMLSSNATWNLDPQRGTLRMWYRPEYTSGSGPGHLARLLTLVSARDQAIALWWSLTVSADGSCLQLVCETTNGPAACASAPVSFQAGTWHMLTLGYTETNCAVFLDDQEVAVGGGLLTVPPAAAPFSSLIIGSGLSGEVAAGQIEEFAAFTGRPRSARQPVTAFGVDPVWEIQGCWARLNPVAQLGPITPEEEATTREQMVARRAALLTSRQTATETLAVNEGMLALDEGGTSYAQSGDTNLWFLPPVIQGTNIVLTLYSADTNFTSKSYEIYFTSALLNTNTPWSAIAVTGRLGQITFTNPILDDIRLYRAVEGSDWDGDGIPNSMDADPRSTNVGVLTITIQSPTNNSTIY